MLRALRFVLFLSGLTIVTAFAGAPTFQLVAVYDYHYPNYPPITTFGGAIANNGTAVGVFTSSRLNGTQSYERFANGRFSAPIIFPAAPGSITYAEGINNAGLICGYFSPPNEIHGFFYDGQTYTQYDVPGADDTFLFGLNDAGDFIGYYYTGNPQVQTAFVSIGGTITPIEIPGVSIVSPSAINNLGQIVGYYIDPVNPTLVHGFFRDADGTLIYPLDYPGSRTSALFGLNDKGQIVGSWDDSNFTQHGLYLTLPNHFSSYDSPTGTTVFHGINKLGRISGYTYDSGDRGLLVQLKR
jgi:uncharacterized membrane protein